MKKCLMSLIVLFVMFANARNEIIGKLVINNESSQVVEIGYLFHGNRAIQCSPQVKGGTLEQRGSITIDPKKKKMVKLTCCLENVSINYAFVGGTFQSRVIKTDCSKMYEVILMDSKKENYAITAQVNGKVYEIE